MAKPAELSLEALGDTASDPEAVARLVAARLRTYPHFVLIKGLPPTEDSQFSRSVAQAIADMHPVNPRPLPSLRSRARHFARSIAKGDPRNALRTPDDAPGLWFSRVEITPEKPLSDGRITSYSRTNQPLDLHTDCTYRPNPQELVVFQMVRDDPDGGDTLMAAVEDIAGHLDKEVMDTLMRPAFPFGPRTPLPVFWEQSGELNIRFYRSQIDAACKKADPLTEDQAAALDALEMVLSRADVQFRFHIHAGEIIFIHNTKALHARTGFSGDSERLMYRIRVPAGCLG